MDQVQLFSASRVVIVAGKGGVGKTTVTAASALAIARSGRRVLAVEVDGTGALSRLLAVPRPSSNPVASPLAQNGRTGEPLIQLVAIDPEPALSTYLTEHGLGRLGSRLARNGMLALVATATPGIRDLVVLGRLRQLAERKDFDVVLVDAPATGHAVSFLSTPADVLRTARGGGPIRNQAQASADFLADSEMVTVSLVTTPQATPVKELVETAYSIEDGLNLKLGPIIVNLVEPTLAALGGHSQTSVDTDAYWFLSERVAAERNQIDGLTSQLALPRVELPRLDSAPNADTGLETLAEVLRSVAL